MINPAQRQRIASRVKRLQFFFASFLVAGFAFALAIGFYKNWLIDFNQISLMSLLGIGTGLMMYVFSYIIPGLVVPDASQIAAQLAKENQATDIRTISDDAIVDLLVSQQVTYLTLVGVIMLAAIFLNLVTYFLELCGMAALVASLGLLILSLRFPTTGRVMRMIERRTELVRRNLQLIRIE